MAGLKNIVAVALVMIVSVSLEGKWVEAQVHHVAAVTVGGTQLPISLLGAPAESSGSETKSGSHTPQD